MAAPLPFQFRAQLEHIAEASHVELGVFGKTLSGIRHRRINLRRDLRRQLSRSTINAVASTLLAGSRIQRRPSTTALMYRTTMSRCTPAQSRITTMLSDW